MKVAVPVWEGKISPVLDTAGKLLVVDTRGGDIVSRTEVPIAGKNLHEKADCIKRHADVLICGALSRSIELYLTSLGIEVFPWVMGDAERLIEIYASGRIPEPAYVMPGCRRSGQRRCTFRRRQKKQWGHDKSILTEDHYLNERE